MIPEGVKVASWTALAGFVSLAASAGTVDGLAWLFQPVTLPLAAVVVLALLPAESFGTLAQTLVDRANRRAGGES